MSRTYKIPLITLFLIITLTFGTKTVHAYNLDLLGILWSGKSTVTVLIKPAKGVSQEAVDDVEQAICDWDDALAKVDRAPRLSLVSNVKSADIVIHMKVGGGSVLGYALPKTVSPFSCVLKSVSIQLSGKAFGLNFSDAGTRNVVRHELGHALGLGHSDDPNDFMYGAAESSEIFGNKEVCISTCGMEGIQAVYSAPTCKDIPESVTCDQNKSEPFLPCPCP